MKEKRRHVRLPLESRVFIELLAPSPGGEEPAEIALCQTEDVSRRGFRVELGTELQRGAILQIGVDLPGAEETLHLAAEVRWCGAVEDSPEPRWAAGFELLDAEGTDLELWQALLEGMEG